MFCLSVFNSYSLLSLGYGRAQAAYWMVRKLQRAYLVRLYHRMMIMRESRVRRIVLVILGRAPGGEELCIGDIARHISQYLFRPSPRRRHVQPFSAPVCPECNRTQGRGSDDMEHHVMGCVYTYDRDYLNRHGRGPPPWPLP